MTIRWQCQLCEKKSPMYRIVWMQTRFLIIVGREWLETKKLMVPFHVPGVTRANSATSSSSFTHTYILLPLYNRLEYNTHIPISSIIAYSPILTFIYCLSLTIVSYQLLSRLTFQFISNAPALVPCPPLYYSSPTFAAHWKTHHGAHDQAQDTDWPVEIGKVYQASSCRHSRLWTKR